ncbi:MAG: peptidoglycan DD-metalloendopeptidase family protein [Nitrospirota bacterium]
MTNYGGRRARRKRYRPAFLIGCAALAAVVLAAAVRHAEPPSPVEAASLLSAQVPVPDLPAARPLHIGAPIGEPPGPPQERPHGQVSSGTVSATDTFYGLLTGHGIAPADVLVMARASRRTFDLTQLREGQPYTLTSLAEGGLVEFRYRVDIDHDYVARLERGVFHGEMEAIPWDIHVRHLSGEIRDSVFETLRNRGLGDAIAMKLAVIYAWDIEFAVDIRPGDTYNILFQEKWRNGEFVDYGKVLAATIHNRGEEHSAVYFKDSTGFEDYFDPTGHSMRKQFLRSPVNYTRISSRFTRRRFHPILKQVRPHLGVDLAAPRGTPVRSVGDGRVLIARRKGGSGNMVKIRHSERYMTAYLHLSRFAKGVREGARVEQGQVIGYVGSTGLATGPHLCYRFYVNGRYVNPLTVKFPAAKPVKEEYRREFLSLATSYMERLATNESANRDPSPPG